MTRENKLALVVGFALILFVGILISDHFSTARNQSAADLRRPAGIDPLISQANNNVIDLQPRMERPVAPTLVTSAILPVNDPLPTEEVSAVDQSNSVHMGVRQLDADTSATPQGFVAVRPEPPAEQIPVVYHDVRGGESLYAICRQHYGDTALIKSLAAFNNMKEKDNLRVGRRLRIPAADQLGGHTPSTVASSSEPTVAATPAKPANTTYTVKAGDSLAQIAQRFLGSKTKWKKLHDMNRNVVDDPHDLKVGTVLRVL